MLPVIGRGQLLALKLQLARRPVRQMGERFAERLRFLAHPLRAVALGIKAVEQFGEGGRGALITVAIVLPDGNAGEILRRAVL